MSQISNQIHSVAVDPNCLVFNFQAPVFRVPGCVFRKDVNGKGIVFCVPFGNMSAALPVAILEAEFKVGAGTNDAALLEQVAHALKYMKEVRPGDSIPWEVIDGCASWMVDEKHLLIVKARLARQLSEWFGKGGETPPAEGQGSIEADGAVLAQTVERAFDDICRVLGCGSDRRQEVVDQIERLASELAYIEALRDRFAGLKDVMAALKSLYSAYRGDRGIQEVITRCITLLNKPMEQVFCKFELIDANTGELLQMLKRFDAQLEYIRGARNELREAHLLWDDLFELWDALQPSRNADTERVVRETYRFVARHFPAGVNWAGGM